MFPSWALVVAAICLVIGIGLLVVLRANAQEEGARLATAQYYLEAEEELEEVPAYQQSTTDATAPMPSVVTPPVTDGNFVSPPSSQPAAGLTPQQQPIATPTPPPIRNFNLVSTETDLGMSAKGSGRRRKHRTHHSASRTPELSYTLQPPGHRHRHRSPSWDMVKDVPRSPMSVYLDSSHSRPRRRQRSPSLQTDQSLEELERLTSELHEKRRGFNTQLQDHVSYMAEALHSQQPLLSPRVPLTQSGGSTEGSPCSSTRTTPLHHRLESASSIRRQQYPTHSRRRRHDARVEPLLPVASTSVSAPVSASSPLSPDAETSTLSPQRFGSPMSGLPVPSLPSHHTDLSSPRIITRRCSETSAPSLNRERVNPFDLQDSTPPYIAANTITRTFSTSSLVAEKGVV